MPPPVIFLRGLTQVYPYNKTDTLSHSNIKSLHHFIKVAPCFLMLQQSIFQQKTEKQLKNPIVFFHFDKSKVPPGLRAQLNAKHIIPQKRSRTFCDMNGQHYAMLTQFNRKLQVSKVFLKFTLTWWDSDPLSMAFHIEQLEALLEWA